MGPRVLGRITVIALIGLAAAACGGSGDADPTATASLNSTATPSGDANATTSQPTVTHTATRPASPGAGDEASPTKRALEGFVANSVVFGDVRWTVKEALLSNISPDSFSTAGEQVSEHEYLYLKVSGETLVRGLGVTYPASLFVLSVNGIVRSPVGWIEAGSRLEVPPDFANEDWLAYEASGNDAQQAELVISSSGLELAKLPLTVQLNPSPFPVVVTIESGPKPATSSNIAYAFSPIRAEVDTSSGVRDLPSSVQRQVEQGRLFIRVLGQVDTQDSGNLFSEQFRFLVDGLPRENLTYINEIPRVGTVTDVELLGVFEPGQTVELVVGGPGYVTATFAISIPETIGDP